MKAKFDSACKKCGNATKEGEDIFYDYDTKVACGNLECYKEQGGSAIEEKKKSSGGYGAPPRTALEKITDCDAISNYVLNTLLPNVVQGLDSQDATSTTVISKDQKLVFVESLVKTIMGAR